MEHADRIAALQSDIRHQERILETAPRGSLTWSVAVARLAQLWEELDELAPPPTEAV